MADKPHPRFVHDGKRGYYKAFIVGERGEGDKHELRFHWEGYKKSQDIWLLATSDRILEEGARPPRHWQSDRACMDDDDEQWEVLRLTGKRRKIGGVRHFELEWVPKEDGTPWPLEYVKEEDISPELVEETLNPPEEPARPYVETQPDVVSPEVARQIVVPWADDIARQGAKLLMRQKEEWAARKFFSMSPCPPWLFKALQAYFREVADDPTDVSDIYSVKGARGGQAIMDQFDIEATDLVGSIVGRFNTAAAGHGALVLRENNTAVMLVPPLEFKFFTKRSEAADGADPPTQLVVTGHFMCLVDKKGKGGMRWQFDEERVKYEPENKLAYKMAVAAAVRELGSGVVPARVLEFLSIL